MGNILFMSTISQPFEELSEYLENVCGFTLIKSSNPELLIDLEYSSIQLVLLNIDHSSSSFIEILPSLKYRLSENLVPVIGFIPQGTSSEEIVRFFQAGVDNCIFFPSRYEELFARMKVHIEYSENIRKKQNELENLQKEIALIQAEKTTLLQEYDKSIQDREALNAIINTVVAHDSLVEDQLDSEIQAAKYEADHDPLTQIFNRLGFNTILAKVVQKAEMSGDSFALIMLDIDHFKCINDTYGHDAGDRVLVALTVCIRMHLPEGCVFARWGGEEFMVIAPRYNVGQAFDLAEYLRISIEKLRVDNIDFFSCSFGATAYKRGETIDSLFDRVDSCLYEAKERGRNQVRFR